MCVSVRARCVSDDLLLERLERDTNTLRQHPIGRGRGADIGFASFSASHLCSSRASTLGGSEARRGVGGAESVLSDGSHSALCSDCSWLR